MTKKVLVVAVHPDDETLGCGGTLLKHKECGDEIHWLICTAMYEENGFHRTVIEKRKNEIDDVSGLYAFDSTHCLGLPAMQVDEHSMSELIAKISAVIKICLLYTSRCV